MKKHLIAFCFLAITAIMSAKSMDSTELREDDSSASSSGASPSRPLAPIDVSGTLASLAQNPQNIQHVGGWFGTTYGATPIVAPRAWQETFSSMAKGYNDALDRCAIAEQSARDLHESVQNAAAVRLALAEAQEKLVAFQRAQKELEDKLLAEQALAKSFKEKQTALLSEASQKDAVMLLDRERIAALEREKRDLEGAVGELEKNVREIERLAQDNLDREASLPKSSIASELTEKKGDSERVRESIQKIITQNKERITALEERNSVLESSKKEAEERIGQLQRAIEAHDLYTQVLNKIKDRNVSDDDLALFIMSIKTVQGRDLDQLSEGRKKRLIEALIKVSKPYGERPDDPDALTYGNSFRTLGGLFVPNGLAWKGKPINYDKCKYVGSTFEENAAAIAQHAHEVMSKERQ